MKIITIGDNVVDCYVNDNVYYPGGQAVNVAVNCKRNGIEEVNYIGIFGDDDRANYIQECLKEEGVLTQRCRKVYAHTAQPKVTIDKSGERIFISGPRDSAQHIFAIQLTREDMELIRQYDVCHTTNNSHLEHELPELSKVIPIGFDFSENFDETYLNKVCPFITYGFFSGAELSEIEIVQLIQKVHKLGTKVVGVTRGAKGAVFSDGIDVYRQPIVEVKVIDTMGAGDSFIAGFLSNYPQSKNMKQALQYAAERSALTCTEHGGFGHPHVD